MSYEKSFSTTAQQSGTITLDSKAGTMMYDYSSGTLTLAGNATTSTTIDFSMLYTWELDSSVTFLKNTASSYSGLVATADGTILGNAAGDNAWGTAKDKSLLLEAYERSGNNDNTIRVTSTIDQSSGVKLIACDTGEELYKAENLKYNGKTWTSLVFDSSIVKNVYYSVAEGTEGANTVITSSNGKWKKSYATVVFNNADTTADATVLNEEALLVDYNTTELSNLSKDIIIGGSGQLILNTWGGDDNARGRDIDISNKALYLESSTKTSGALELRVFCGNITLGDIHLIGDTKITKESKNADSQVIFAGDVSGNYALTLAPARNQDRFDGVVFTGNVDVKKINVATKAEITFLGTTNIGEFVTNGDADFTIGQDAEHTAKMTLGRLEMGNNAGATGADSLTVHAGSLLKITGNNNTATEAGHYKTASLLIGEWNDETVLNIDGSLLAKDATMFTGDQGGSINIGSAGTVAIKGIASVKGENSSVLNLTLADGGKLILGSEGISSNNKNPDIRFGAGIVGMYADTTTLGTPITLQSASGTTFDTAKYTFADNGDSISQLDGAAGGTMTISGVVSGGGKLIKSGVGTLKLSADNTYSGGTEITAGTLELTDAGTLGTADTAVINSGAKLQFSGATDKTITQNLTGGGEIAKQGNGRVTLTGTVGDAYTSISKLSLSGGTLELQNSSYINSIAMSGSAHLTFSGENIKHTVYGDFSTTGASGTLTIAAGSTLNVNGHLINSWGISGGIIANGTLDVNVIRLTYDQSEQSVSGTGSVVANQFITGNHGTYNVSVSELIVGSGGLSVGYDGKKAQLNLSSENATINGAVTIAASSKLEVSGGSTTIHKNVSGVGALALSGGSLTLNGESNSINSFTYTSGTLNYRTLTAGAVNISSESTLSNNGHLTATGSLAGNIVNTEAGKVTFARGMSIAAETTASITGNGITEFCGTLTNNGTLTLGGMISLSGDINSDFIVRREATDEGKFVLDTSNTSVYNTTGDGFKLTSGGSYWLVQGGSTNLNDITQIDGYTVTQVTDANQEDGDRVGDVYISASANVGKTLYITSGALDVVGTGGTGAGITGAVSYVLNGDAAVLNLLSGSVNLNQISYSANVTDNKAGSISLGQDATLLVNTLPSGISFNSLLNNGYLTGTGKIQVHTSNNNNNAALTGTSFEGVLEVVGNNTFQIGAGQGNKHNVSSLSEIILTNGAKLYYLADGDNDADKADFQKLSVYEGTGNFYVRDSNGAWIEFGSMHVEEGAQLSLTSHWNYNMKINQVSGSGSLVSTSAENKGNGDTANIEICSLAGFAGNISFSRFSSDTNNAAPYNITVNTGEAGEGEDISFNSLSVNQTTSFTLNVQDDTTIGCLTITGNSGTVNVSAGKTLSLGGGTAEAQKRHSIGTLNAATGSLSLGDYANITLGSSTTHSVGTLSTGNNNSVVILSEGATLNLVNKLAASNGTYTSGNSDSKASLDLSIQGAAESKLSLALSSGNGWNDNGTINLRPLTEGGNTVEEVYIREGALANAVFHDGAITNLGGANLTMAKGTQLVLRKVVKGNDNFGAGKITLEGTTELNLYGNLSFTISNQIESSSGSLNVTGSGSSSITFTDALNLHKLESSKNVTLSGGTADSPVVHRIGALTASSSAVTINSGILQVSTGDKNYNVKSTTVQSGATLQFASDNDMINYGLTDMTVTLNGGAWELGTGRQTLGKNFKIVLKNGSISGSNAIANSYNQGSQDGYGALDFYEVGGTITSTGDSDITGGIRLRKGITIDVQSGELTIDAILNGNNSSSGITKKGAGTLSFTMGATYGESWYTGATKIEQGLIKYDLADAKELSYSGVISGDGAIEKAGEGTLSLLGNNSFTGGTTISNGTLTTQHTNALGTGNVNITGDGKLSIDSSLNVSGQVSIASTASAQISSTDTSLNLGTTGSVKKNASDSSHITIAANNSAASLTAKDNNVELIQIEQDASFTIADMELSNVTITAAEENTKVNMSGLSASDVQLTKGEFHMLDKAQPQVGTGGSAINLVEGGPTGLQFSTSLLNGMTLGVDASMVVDLGDLSGFTGMDSGKPTFSITLEGFSLSDYTGTGENKGLYFAADSWLGQLLVAQGASQYVKGDTLEAGAQATAGSGSGVSVRYYNSTSSVGTVIIISGLQVPEPATSTLGLIALTALVSRRRRK